MTRLEQCQELAFDITAGSRRLRAKSISTGDRELANSPAALVFLHEGLGSITQWRDFPAALVRATGLPALVYDRYGYGQSDRQLKPPNDLYLEEEAQLRLPAVLEACGIDAPILIGHSDGATIALLFAALYPNVPLAVVSEAAHVYIEKLSIQGIWKTVQDFNSTHLRDRLERHHGDKVDSMFHGWSDVWLSPEHHDWSMLERLAAITCPVLAIQGEDDEYGTPAQLRAITRRVSGPTRTLLLPSCGHAPHHQARERILDEIQGFIRDLALPHSR